MASENTLGDLVVLQRMFERDRENAWQIAHYQRSRRDEVTSKIRFALAGLNGAAAVAVMALLSSLPMGLLDRTGALWSLLGFVLGVLFSGIALVLHEAHLTFLAGQSFARARYLDTCISALNDPDLKRAQAVSEEAMGKAHAAEHQMASAENGYGIFATHLAAACWIASSLALLVRAAGYR